MGRFYLRNAVTVRSSRRTHGSHVASLWPRQHRTSKPGCFVPDCHDDKVLQQVFLEDMMTSLHYKAVLLAESVLAFLFNPPSYSPLTLPPP